MPQFDRHYHIRLASREHAGHSKDMMFARFIKDNLPWLSAGMLLTFLSSFGQTFFISIFAGKLQSEFGLTEGEWGAIYMIGTGASAVAMLWAGGLTDRFRTRALGAIVLLMLAASCLFMALNTWAALLPLVIFALRFSGQGMVSHLAVISMSRWFIATRGRALSVAGFGFAIGEALLPVCFVALMLVMDWRWLWVGAALMALCAIPVLIRLLKQERTPQSHAETDQSLGMNNRHWLRSEVLKHRLFWFMVPAIVGQSAFNTAFFFLQVRFAQEKGWTHLELVSLFPVYTATAVAAMLVSGWLLDKFGTPKLIPFFQVPMAIGFLVFSTTSSLLLTMVGLIFIGLTAGANSTLPNAFWAEFYGTQNLGSIKAMATAVMVFGSAIGPGLTGILIDYQIGIETQYLVISTYFVATTLLMAFGIRQAARSL